MTGRPLYLRLQEKPYPSHQRLDAASIKWLIAYAKPVPIDVYSLIPNYKPLPASALALDEAWFANESIALSIHGVRHLVRVCLYSWILLQRPTQNWQWSSKDMDQLTRAALLHDLRRLNDNADIEHGRRSASWARNSAKVTDKNALFAVAYHNDEAAPESGLAKSLAMLELIKTADALDRYRLPKAKWWPDPSKMPLPVDSTLVEFCKYMTIETERVTCGTNSFDETMLALRQWLSQAGLI